MPTSSSVFLTVWAAAVLSSVSSDVIIYSVTFVPCVQNSTCPQGNPTYFNRTFALNGTVSPNLTLKVGDRLEFDLATNVSIHPLAICQNSPVPSFCLGAANASLLNTPITLAGTNTSVTFTTAGIYYYGCLNHPGMGATINVTQTATTTTNVTQTALSTTTASTTSTGKNNAGHQLSMSSLVLTGVSLFAIILI